MRAQHCKSLKLPQQLYTRMLHVCIRKLCSQLNCMGVRLCDRKYPVHPEILRSINSEFIKLLSPKPVFFKVFELVHLHNSTDWAIEFHAPVSIGRCRALSGNPCNIVMSLHFTGVHSTARSFPLCETLSRYLHCTNMCSAELCSNKEKWYIQYSCYTPMKTLLAMDPCRAVWENHISLCISNISIFNHCFCYLVSFFGFLGARNHKMGVSWVLSSVSWLNA